MPQVRGELATILATSVLSVLGTLSAVRWAGTPLHVKHPCAGAGAAAAVTSPGPAGRQEEAEAALAGSDPRVGAQWLAQARESSLWAR